ncbi:hypothetical protein GOODEAATRI_007265 [Goodea atripinnis]|uniref:Uncharacterized protein n=1 Tax=Goodea atripinnis TaxID=208336 RepID=A0ABV0PC41_9TELE
MEFNLSIFQLSVSSNSTAKCVMTLFSIPLYRRYLSFLPFVPLFKCPFLSFHFFLPKFLCPLVSPPLSFRLPSKRASLCPFLPSLHPSIHPSISPFLFWFVKAPYLNPAHCRPICIGYFLGCNMRC